MVEERLNDVDVTGVGRQMKCCIPFVGGSIQVEWRLGWMTEEELYDVDVLCGEYTRSLIPAQIVHGEVPFAGHKVKCSPAQIVPGVQVDWECCCIVEQHLNNVAISPLGRLVERGVPTIVGNIRVERWVAWMSEKGVNDVKVPSSARIVKHRYTITVSGVHIDWGLCWVVEKHLNDVEALVHDRLMEWGHPIAVGHVRVERRLARMSEEEFYDVRVPFASRKVKRCVAANFLGVRGMQVDGWVVEENLSGVEVALRSTAANRSRIIGHAR